MNKINWNKPKYLIRQFLNILSTISLILSVVFIFIFTLWKNDALPLNTIDFNLPDYYSLEIELLHENALSAPTSEMKYEAYALLSKSLESSTFLNKFYPLITEANTYLLKTLINENNISEAEKIAYNWQAQFPYDFNVKFKYAEVLELISFEKAISYYDELYQKHPDIDLLVSKYVDLLLKSGNFDLAYHIAKESSDFLIDNTIPSFTLISKDSRRSNFSVLGSKPILKEQFTYYQNQYNIKINQKVSKLTGLRLLVLKLKLNSVINDISVEFIANSERYKNHPIKPIKDLKGHDKSLLTTGFKPLIELSLPKQLIGYTGNIVINITMNISSDENHELNKILHHPKWEVNYSKDRKFNNKHIQSIYFNEDKDTFTSIVKPTKWSYKFLKINFPPIKNFNVHMFRLKNPNGESLSFKIIDTNDINNDSDGGIKVLGDNPYIILKLNKSIKNEFLFINLGLGHEI